MGNHDALELPTVPTGLPIQTLARCLFSRYRRSGTNSTLGCLDAALMAADRRVCPRPWITSRKGPLAGSPADLMSNQQDLSPIVDDQRESRPVHLGTRVVNAATPGVFGRPHFDGYPVGAEGEIVVVRQHVVLEPLGVKAFSLLNLEATSDSPPTPYLNAMSLTLVIQADRTHSDAGFFSRLPYSSASQSFALILVAAGQAPFVFLLSIRSLNKENLSLVIYHQSETRWAWSTSVLLRNSNTSHCRMSARAVLRSCPELVGGKKGTSFDTLRTNEMRVGRPRSQAAAPNLGQVLVYRSVFHTPPGRGGVRELSDSGHGASVYERAVGWGCGDGIGMFSGVSGVESVFTLTPALSLRERGPLIDVRG